MYFVQYQPLKEKLQSRSLTDREALPYFILLIASTTVGMVFPLTAPDPNTWDWIGNILSIVFAVGGVFYAYVCNGGRHGFDLVQKYTVIGWIVTVRFLLICLPLLFVLYWILDAGGLATEETNGFDTFLYGTFEVVFYWRIGRNIADTK